MKALSKKDIGKEGVTLIKSNEPKADVSNASVVIQSPKVDIDNSTNIQVDILKNIEELLKAVLEKEIPAPVIDVKTPNVEVHPPNVEVHPPDVNIDNKTSEGSKNIEILLKELILQKKTPIEVNIDKEESAGWDSIKFTIKRDEKGFMQEVTATKDEG